MMRNLTLLSVLALSSVAAQAQFITLKDEGGNTVNGTVIDFWCDQNPVPAYVGVAVTCVLNNASATIVDMRRYELEFPDEDTTQNYYCWGECYAPAISGTHPVWAAPATNELDPDAEFIGFHAYYVPLGVAGTACFRYVWFDAANPTDTAWTDICFHATPVGMEDLVGSSFAFSAYPVPSTNGNVELNFDAPRTGQQVYVELHDALGQTIATERIRTGQQRLVLGEGRLAPGLVFATLRVDGEAKATRRLVIAGH